MNYKISIEASYDLEKIWLYTFENWSLEQADRYLGLLFDEIEYLCLKPNSGKDYGHIREGYLSTSVKMHLIFYRVNKKNDELEIIRILHQMIDIESRLK